MSCQPWHESPVPDAPFYVLVEHDSKAGRARFRASWKGPVAVWCLYWAGIFFLFTLLTGSC